jgi:UDP-N-acetylmuramoyl-L-alanyl-D-glutamate--2,6-diaminopimelate ligase
MKLQQLFTNIPVRILQPSDLPDVEIQMICFDSRKVTPGSLFVALQGFSMDGHRYIPDAVKRGASAIVGMQDLRIEADTPYIQVDDSRKALAYLSAVWHDHPSRKMTMIGVTGTDGKTTTCNLLNAILSKAGEKAGMISTVNAVIGDKEVDTGFHVTTPDAPDVQQYLADMAQAGTTHVVLEATSHGLAQQRVAACEFDIAVVTNITHEHLDFHGSYEAYLDAKAQLFRYLAETQPKSQGNPRLAVLNKDDRSYEALANISGCKKVSYSLKPGADLWAEDIEYSPDGIHFTAVSKEFRQPISTPLVGEFNISNILAAISAAIFGLKISPAVAAQGVASLKSVSGRMERIDMGQNFTAIVDFAHTPNALKVAIEAVRQITRGKVITVFGSAGLRDRAKRCMMAEVSIKMADLTVLTAEDPRTESLDAILAEMADAATSQGGIEGKTFWRVPDRGEAIRTTLRLAQPGDLVVSCGKGHEQSMCFEDIEYAWDDRTAMRAALAEYLGITGPEMPWLPTSSKG